MKAAPFACCRADSLDEALAALAEHGDDAMVLAGGLSLGPMLNMRLARPAMIVDINRLSRLGTIEVAEDELTTGALVRQGDALREPRIANAVPLLHTALAHVGHWQTRDRGSLGGSVAHADPSAEIPLCLATLGGEVELVGTAGRRRIAAELFCEGALTTARAPEELLIALHWPRARDGDGHAFAEISQRHGDFAILAAAAWARRDADGGFMRFRLGLGGIEDRPCLLEGRISDAGDTDIADMVAAFATSRDALSDARASADYRRHLARHLGAQVLRQALDRAAP